uniref:KIND domain-containing protein n=1 Tax=Aquila chrysaetos chrysaetos TaxID=223781 RepID=A0A663DT50_AQUCH
PGRSGACGGCRITKVSLAEILRCFEHPISEEQAWAVCFQCCRKMEQLAQGLCSPLHSDKVSLHLYLRYVCRYNSAVAEGQLRRCRCLWKLSRCLNLLCSVKVPLSPAIWKMKQNARIELK